jgi:purine-binding chemotaxis protein CheW
MEEINQYLEFRMEGEEYALKVSHVREILEVPQITYIPRMPEYMPGVINLRGSVVPLVDLKRKFGMRPTEINPETAIIVLEIPGGQDDDEGKILTIGIFADAVHKVVTIEKGQIEPPPRIGNRIDASFIEGMGRIDGSFITILAIDGILSAEEMEQAHANNGAPDDGKPESADEN